MLPLNLVMVDDEPLARDRARRLLQKIGDVEIVAEFGNAREALEYIESHPPDVVLLDINMPELDGLRLIEALDDPPAIILATAYDHHAVRAFELEVVDYLLKPYSAERLARALAKVRKQLCGVAAPPAAPAQPIRIPADTGRGIELISAEQLAGAVVEEGVVFLLRTDGERLCYAGSLQDLETAVQPAGFVRASRRAVVKPTAIHKYETSTEGGLLLHLDGGFEEHVSRRRARVFRAILG